MAIHSQESAIHIADLMSEITLLLNDYSLIHDAPKSLVETLTDVKYLQSTLLHLGSIFSDPSPESKSETMLYLPLSA